MTKQEILPEPTSMYLLWLSFMGLESTRKFVDPEYEKAKLLYIRPTLAALLRDRTKVKS